MKKKSKRMSQRARKELKKEEERRRENEFSQIKQRFPIGENKARSIFEGCEYKIEKTIKAMEDYCALEKFFSTVDGAIILDVFQGCKFDMELTWKSLESLGAYKIQPGVKKEDPQKPSSLHSKEGKIQKPVEGKTLNDSLSISAKSVSDSKAMDVANSLDIAARKSPASIPPLQDLKNKKKRGEKMDSDDDPTLMMLVDMFQDSLDLEIIVLAYTKYTDAEKATEYLLSVVRIQNDEMNENREKKVKRGRRNRSGSRGRKKKGIDISRSVSVIMGNSWKIPRKIKAESLRDQLDKSDNERGIRRVNSLPSLLRSSNRSSSRRWSQSSATLGELLKFRALKELFPLVNESIVEDTYRNAGCDFVVALHWMHQQFPNTAAMKKIKQIETKGNSQPLIDRKLSGDNKGNLYTAKKKADTNIPSNVSEYLWVFLKKNLDASRGFKSSSNRDKKAISRHRERTQNLQSKRDEMYRRISASSSGANVGAVYLARQKEIQSIKHDILEARREAMKSVYLESNAHVDNLKKVDLHGLYVAEAQKILRALFALAQRNGRTEYMVVTGVGRHTIGDARLAPAVKKFVAKHGHSWQNAGSGCLKVYFKGNT
mmetsp:Transcript_18670/g.27917  ORF Transcript_18670/g.27917 Transcript_18670/m.27917 type:complete len:600 (+) Transcript_18670:78-1877(+)